MSMHSSGRSMFFASIRRVEKGTLAAPDTVSLVRAPSQVASSPRGSRHTAVWRCTASRSMRRYGAPQDRRMQHALGVLVVDIGAAPAQQPQVLEALDGSSDRLHLR